MPPFSYAKVPVFQYQRFDAKTVQFTNIPVWKPPTPPPVEDDHNDKSDKPSDSPPPTETAEDVNVDDNAPPNTEGDAVGQSQAGVEPEDVSAGMFCIIAGQV